MEVLDSFSFNGLSLEEKVKVIKKLKQLTREGEKQVISEQLNNSSLRNTGGNLTCDNDDDRCVCTDFMYTNNIIPNRHDLDKPYLFTEYLKCSSDNNGTKRGIYQISCIKEDCPAKGPIYVGKALRIHQRISRHINAIKSPFVNKRLHQIIHHHFRNNNHNVEEHFRYAIVEEVKYDSSKSNEILVRENFWMDFFGTYRSWYGCNRLRNIIEEEKVPKPTSDGPGPSSAKKSKSEPKGDKVEWAGSSAVTGTNHKAQDHSFDKWLIAIALKNLDNQKGTRTDLTGFSHQYFKPDYEINIRDKQKVFATCFDPNHPSHSFAKEVLEDWFIQEPYDKSKPLQYEGKGGPKPQFTFGLNPAMLTVINDELQMELLSGTFDDLMYTASDLIYGTLNDC